MRDIWLEHMEDRCGCSDDGFEPEQEAEIAAQPTMTANEWIRSNPAIPTDEDKFRAKFNLAPRRL
jgi:hypothetical protein